MRSQRNSGSKLSHYIGAPKKFLKRARDFYVEAMVNIDGKVGFAAPPMAPVPRKFDPRPQRNSSESEDIPRVRRSMSARNSGSKKETEKSVEVRCYSVMGLGRIGTIEEDRSYEFEEESGSAKNDILYSRSKSYAVPHGRSGYY
ncbi:hypothetical protein POM88_031772 [Heracleum sosnowskyi]|uniref:Uncharacterized protein n=1 Tax=Heracleum sosnowskyi TaxID=360622 RepID=A0AAD8HY09_9APIA|nr:hypothetical protein POM88_031772 [Heracleum sosnowskyi]